MKGSNDINQLKEACEVLGLDYSAFVEPENQEKKPQKKMKPVQKGITNPKPSVQVSQQIDYKALYEKQLQQNKELLGLLSEFNSSFKSQFSALEKGVSDLNERFSKIESTPAHSPKSFRSKLQVVEKGFSGNQGNVDYQRALSMKNSRDVKELKAYLGNKMMEEFQKGVQNGFYEQAAMTLDSNGILTDKQINVILKQDKILITL